MKNINIEISIDDLLSDNLLKDLLVLSIKENMPIIVNDIRDHVLINIIKSEFYDDIKKQALNAVNRALSDIEKDNRHGTFNRQLDAVIFDCLKENKNEIKNNVDDVLSQDFIKGIISNSVSEILKESMINSLYNGDNQ